jgi:hypothetical protein
MITFTNEESVEHTAASNTEGLFDTGTLEKGARRLARTGPHSTSRPTHTTVVQETRSAFQTAMQRKFIDEVERLSSRKVLAFVSNAHVGPDKEIELFMLTPPSP